MSVIVLFVKPGPRRVEGVKKGGGWKLEKWNKGKERAACANNKKRHKKRNIRVRENLRIYTNKCSFDSACPIREEKREKKMTKKKCRREGDELIKA